MRIRKIEITARRSFKHPLERGTTISPEVKLRSVLSASDNVRQAASLLQMLAEQLVQEQEYMILRNIEIAEAGMADDDEGYPIARAVHNTNLCRAALKGK